MKKILLTLLSLALCVSMCSCCCTSIFNKEPNEEQSVESQEESKKTDNAVKPDVSKEETSKKPEVVDPIKEVDTLIDQGNYAEAYEKLLAMTDNEAAKERLDDFIWVYSEMKTSYINTVNRYVYTYNEKGLTLTEKVYYTDSEGPDILTYYYDSSDRVIRQEFASYNGGDGHTCEYTYDTRGNKIKEVFKYVGAEITTEYTYNAKNLLVYEMTTSCYESDTYVTSRRYTYNGEGQLIEEGTVSNGVYEKWNDYSYDERGNLIKEENEYSIHQYEYNENDLLVKESVYNVSMDSTTITVYSYDNQGKLLEKKDSSEYENGYEKYSYDKYGNVIKIDRYNSDFGISNTEYSDYICFYIAK